MQITKITKTQFSEKVKETYKKEWKPYLNGLFFV